MTVAYGHLAHRFVGRKASAPASLDGVRLMETAVKSGHAMSLRKGIAHAVEAAAIVTEGDRAVLVCRWRCGGGSVQAVALTTADVSQIVQCANCREASKYVAGPGIYRCFDADDRLLYIGSTVNVFQRVRNHRGSTAWWDGVARVESEGFLSIGAARLAETLAIRAECPAYNIDGNTLQVAAS